MAESERERVDKFGERAEMFGERADKFGERADKCGERDRETDKPNLAHHFSQMMLSYLMWCPLPFPQVLHLQSLLRRHVHCWLVLHHLLNISLRTTAMKLNDISNQDTSVLLRPCGSSPIPLLPRLLSLVVVGKLPTEVDVQTGITGGVVIDWYCEHTALLL